MHECSSCKQLMLECSFRALNFTLVHNMHASRHACSSSYTRQQNERLVHARVQFPMVIRHRSVVRTRKMLRAFLKTCRAVQLLHACVVKFKVSGTVCSNVSKFFLFSSIANTGGLLGCCPSLLLLLLFPCQTS